MKLRNPGSVVLFLVVGLWVSGAFASAEKGQKAEKARKAVKTHKAAAHTSDHAHLLFRHAFKKTHWNGKLQESGSRGTVRTSHHGKSVDKIVHCGVWKWGWENGKAKAETRYCDEESAKKGLCHWGNKHGLSRGWYASGKLRWRQDYSDGVAKGHRVEFYEGGEKKSSTMYARGKRNGAYTLWWWNGRKSMGGTFVDGERVGVWKEWYDNGKLKRSISYKAGQLNGRWAEWWWVCKPAGCVHQKVLEGGWAAGKKHGYWRRWNHSGVVVSTQKWENGTRVQ